MISKHLRFMQLTAVIAALAVPTLSATNADAQACISSKAKQNLAHCPGGKFQANITKRPQVSFSSAPQGIKKKARQTSLKPVNPTDIAKTAQRDERRARLKPKVRKLLITEIANVERLYKNTPKKDKDRPRLMRRLAEGYVELESSAFRDKVQNEVKAQQYRRKNPKLASKAKRNAKKAKAIIKTARKNAIKYYRRLKKQYPKWCQFPKGKPGHRGCMDEVLYYLAYEYEQAGNLDKARTAYLELTENWKKSRFVPNAYLAFGELFFNEAQGDPSKWPIAGNFYKEVLKYKPPENKLWGYATYKLGYVYWNQGDYSQAIGAFKSVIEFGMKYGQLPNAKGLARSARRDIIPVYALKGDPKKAYTFFKPLSGDKGGSNSKTFKMMEDLGQNLIDTGHYPEAIVLYEDLKKRNRGDKFCYYQAQISQAVMASKSGNKDPIVKELKEQVSIYKSFLKGSHKGGAKLECANITAGLVTETAMAWHLEAVGSGGVRGTGDPKTMEKAEELYELVVANFTSGDFAKFKFPRIVREDWPTVAKIRYAMADLLYFQKKWAKCGPAFDAVVAENPNGPNAAEAAFASVLCYQNIYAEKHKDGSHRKGGGNLDRDKKDKTGADKFKPKPFTKEQKGMITAFNRYVCYIKPPKGDRDAEEQYVEVKYARARTYFEAQHWEEAAEAFRDVAINHPDMDASIYAAQLYLESLNVLGSKIDPSRPSCYDNMEKDVPVFIKNYCEGAKKEENDEQCSILFRIQRDIERIQAEELVKAADKGGPNRIKQYEKAANLYLAMWKKYGKEACLEEKPGCAKNEEILYNAAKAFQAARLIAKAISVRRILIDPKYHLDKTEPAKKAVYEIGGNYQAIAVYDLAAQWYEKFARENPKMENAPEALSDAVVLRLGLGQHEQAIADAKLFNTKYGAKKAAEAAQIAFAIGAHYADRENWNACQRELSRSMARIDSKAKLDVKIQAHALLGRCYANARRNGQADREYSRVIASWKDPNAMKSKLDSLGGSQAQKLRRLAKVLTAVGEALYHYADKKRKKAESYKFPVYKGSGERAEVMKHINTKVKDWMKKKQPAIQEAEKEYLKIVQLKPAPPPRWVIAAGSGVGHMWGDFVAEFRAAPYPKDWDKPGDSPYGDPKDPSAPPLMWSEIRAQYLASLDGASEKQRSMAKRAYITCLDYSVRYQYFDQDSRSCEEWLSKNYPAEFHLIDEFRASPSRVNTGLDERALAINIDGSSVVEDTRAREAAAETKENKGKK
jgi:tetratricopeptide (TPR) repeat protein